MGDPVPPPNTPPGPFADRVHGTVLVVPADFSQLTKADDPESIDCSDERVRCLVDAAKRLNNLGIPFVVAVTKPDLIDDVGPTEISKSDRIRVCRDRIRRAFGALPASRVREVMTYFSAKEESAHINQGWLRLLATLFDVIGVNMKSRPDYVHAAAAAAGAATASS